MSSPGSVGADDGLRLFLALTLPDPVLDALEEWGARELTAGRRVPRENLHITLAFLGRRPQSDLAAVAVALAEARERLQPFELEPRGWRETRSVGMLVLHDPSGEARRLAAGLHDRLEEAGVYGKEARPWLPHLTVLRFRERPRLRPPLPPLGSFAPSGVAAFLSRLHPTGARYEMLDLTRARPDTIRRLNG